jgi:phosphate starvation-inducible PhoH-like protein
MEKTEKILDIPVEHARNIFGSLDSFIKVIERNLHIDIVLRDGSVKVIGEEKACDRAIRTFKELLTLSRGGNVITQQNVNYVLDLVKTSSPTTMESLDSDLVCNTISGKPIKPKTLGQKKYVNEIRDKMMTFGIGPAGTGKTYLAMALAIRAFKEDEVGKIILTRPAIEAGESLGFLPGDLQSKIDPYLRPLYDALYQIMGAESYIKNSEKGLIEVAPLAYMRGRTLDNAFIILDEAQNTTPAQMKMFLTRVGFGSKVVITGDLSQKDLPYNVKSGLDEAAKVLKDIDEIGFCYLTNKDVVRHPLVQKIVHAYEKYEEKNTKNRRQSRNQK